MATRVARWGLVVGLCTFVGCGFAAPLAGAPCRDPATGRFVSCHRGSSGSDRSGSGSPAVAIGLTVVGALLVATVIAFAVAEDPRPPPAGAAPATPPVTATGEDCVLPVAHIQVCRSTRGYRFALPVPEPCAAGARAVGRLRLTCADLARPAYHACLGGAAGWTALRSWESCTAHGLVAAPGDFVPPGRRPDQGVAPD